jgi:hypothetical protein
VGTPYSWIWIPKTRAATFRLAKKLRNEGKVHQAALVASYATDAWQSDPVRIFDAVAYPTTGSPIATDLVLTRRALPGGVAPTQASLRTVADAQFNELKSASGVRLTVPRPRSVVLKAATSVMYSGSVNAVGFGRRRTGFEIFLFIDVHGLYEAEFRSDNAYLDKEMPLFRQIANTIKLA